MDVDVDGGSGVPRFVSHALMDNVCGDLFSAP